MPVFRNYYHCSECGYDWEDVWTATCDDRCSQCNTSIQPEESEEVECSCCGGRYADRVTHDGVPVCDVCFADGGMH